VATAVEAPPRRRTLSISQLDGVDCELHHGSVVIAAITSCTNTFESVGDDRAGSCEESGGEGPRVAAVGEDEPRPRIEGVTDYLQHAGLMRYLEQLRFHTSWATAAPPASVIRDRCRRPCRRHHRGELVVCAVLSGNRNFEGRIQQEVRANYLASPPLVVAYALAGRIDLDLQSEPLGTGKRREARLSARRVAVRQGSRRGDRRIRQVGDVPQGVRRGVHGRRALARAPVPAGDRFAWEPDSTYIRRAPYFDGMPRTPAPVTDIRGARVLCLLADSITTDHISPPAPSARPARPAY